MIAEWDIDLVDEWVNETSLTRIGTFYPTAVAKDTGLSLPDVFSRLLELVKANKLELQWEVRCPICFHTLMDMETQNISGELYCEKCDDNIEITPDIIFPVFKISSEYKAYMMSKKKIPERQNRLLGRFGRTHRDHCLS
ncbi:MAG: hypothetical protein ACRKFN_11465 [Desulfitobacterium sp.]